MNVVSRVPDSERQRILGIMGVDVYVPRTSPIARAIEVAPATRAAQPPIASATSSAGARVLIRGAGADAQSPLMAAVLRAARLRRQDWTMTDGPESALPVFRFGTAPEIDTAVSTVVLPDLAQLRLSVPARRNSWTALRAWLRHA